MSKPFVTGFFPDSQYLLRFIQLIVYINNSFLFTDKLFSV